MRPIGRWTVLLVFVPTLAVCSAAIAVGAGVPVEPGNAKPANFEPASACGCHAALVSQWQASVHAQALSDPAYQAKRAEAAAAVPGLEEFCDKCHGPAATMTGEAGKPAMSAGVTAGVTCAFCHQVVGDAGPRANTSQLVVTDGTRRAQIKDPQAPHKAAYSAFHETSDFCGGCHNVDHPINGMHLEATFREWKNSPWAEEGVTCQDCHMSREPGAIGPYSGVAAPGAPQRPNIYSMTFTGANVELGDPVATTAMLRSAAKIELSAPEVLAGGAGDATVKITNVGAGHHLPTGLTEVREMWLEVYLEGPDGSKTPVGERRFGTILQDDKGKAPVELWEATKIKSDDRIPARGSVTETYRVSLPDGAEEATLTAVLLYRSMGDELAKKAGLKNPVTEMAAARLRVYATEDAREAALRRQTGGLSRERTVLLVAFASLVAVVLVLAAIVLIGRAKRA